MDPLSMNALIRSEAFKVCYRKCLLRVESIKTETVHHTTFTCLENCTEKVKLYIVYSSFRSV